MFDETKRRKSKIKRNKKKIWKVNDTNEKKFTDTICREFCSKFFLFKLETKWLICVRVNDKASWFIVSFKTALRVFKHDSVLLKLSSATIFGSMTNLSQTFLFWYSFDFTMILVFFPRFLDTRTLFHCDRTTIERVIGLRLLVEILWFWFLVFLDFYGI